MCNLPPLIGLKRMENTCAVIPLIAVIFHKVLVKVVDVL